MRLEDILKKRGIAEADLTALAPLLTDAKFRSALEGELTEFEVERDKYKAESEGWGEWYEKTAKPTVDSALEGQRNEAAARAAAEARLRTLQEQGLIKVAGDEAEVKPVPTVSSDVFDPKKHGLVTQAEVASYLELEGNAIAAAADLSAEYSDLFPGKSLYSYQTTDNEGRTLRGMTALRREAIAQKRSVRDYVADKFKFNERRAEIDAKSKADAEAAIRADQRSKDIAELANPNARTPQSSTFTMLPKPERAIKQPWESEIDPSIARVQRVLTKVLQ